MTTVKVSVLAVGDTLTQVGWNINTHHPKVGRLSNIDYHAGYFYGKMDSRGFINGDKVVYLYPDFETVLVGQFLNETMKSAQQAKLKAFKCQNGIMRIKVSKPKTNAPIFRYSPSSPFRVYDQVSQVFQNIHVSTTCTKIFVIFAATCSRSAR